jgi:hypothetical protein
LVMSLESMSAKDVDLQFIVVWLFHEVFKRKENESTSNAALFNKTCKANKKLCFYCKKLKHFVRNCLRKKMMFVTTLNWLDHQFRHNTTQHSNDNGSPFMNPLFHIVHGIWHHLEAIGKGSIKAIMQVGGKMFLITITQVLHVPNEK